MKKAFARLWSLLQDDRQQLGTLYFYALVQGLIALTLPLGIQTVVNLLFGGVISTSLVLLIMLIVSGVFIGGWLQMLQLRISERIQRNAFRLLSFRFAWLIPRFRQEEIDDDYLPELMNRFFDTGSIQKGIHKLLLEFPGAIIQLVFGMILLSLYHPLFLAFGVVFISLLLLLFYITGPSGLRTSIEESNYKYEVAYWLEEMSRIAKPLKFMNVLTYPLRQTDHWVSGYLDSREKHFRVLWVQSWGFILLKTIVTALLLSVGAFLLVDQQINIGQFIAAEIVIILLLNAVEKMITSLDAVYDLLTSVEKIYKVLEKRNETDDISEQAESLPLAAPRIEFRGLTFRYPEGTRDVLRNLQLSITPGEKICLMGIQGSGCTTLLKVMTGSYSYGDGSFLLNGIPLQNFDIRSYRENISILLSTNDLFSGTVYENICLGENYPLQQVKDVTDLVGLTPFIDQLPEGYHTPLVSFGRNLPQNVITKMMLCRIFIRHRSIVLMEDTFTKLQQINRQRIMEKLLNPSSVHTLVFSTYDLSVASRFPRIVVLHEGEIIFDGTYAQLLVHPFFISTLKKSLTSDE